MPNELITQLLKLSGSAYAGFAAGTLLESEPAPKTAETPGAFDLWKAHFEQRISELETALIFERPELFAAGMSWAKEAFLARGIPEDDLVLSLDALADVLHEELPENAADPLPAYIEAAREALENEVHAATPLEPNDSVSRAALEYVVDVLEGNARRAITNLEAAVESGLTVTEVCDQILTAAQREIGRLWHAGQIGVAEEHFATMTAQKALTILFHRCEAKPPNGRTALIACPAGNVHDLGLRMLAEHFDVEGWRAILLGADMPTPDLVESVDHYDPDVLVLSATLSRHLVSLRDTIAAIRASQSNVPILAGGNALNAVDGLWQQIGADAWSPSISDAVTQANRLLQLN